MLVCVFLVCVHVCVFLFSEQGGLVRVAEEALHLKEGGGGVSHGTDATCVSERDDTCVM